MLCYPEAPNSPKVSKLKSKKEEVVLTDDESSNEDMDEDSNDDDADDSDDAEHKTISLMKMMPIEMDSVSIRQQIKLYYMSKKYALFTKVLGTMMAFFMVGARVESFRFAQGYVDTDVVSFHLAIGTTFWLLFTWLVMFIISSFIILVHLIDFRSYDQNKNVRL